MPLQQRPFYPLWVHCAMILFFGPHSVNTAAVSASRVPALCLGILFRFCALPNQPLSSRVWPWLWLFWVLPLCAASAQEFVAREGYVLGTEVSLRKLPTRRAPSLATLQLGTSVTLLAEAQGWMSVRVRPGLEGWVLGSLLATELPTLAGLLNQAHVSTGSEKLLWLERARALEPWNVEVLTQLVQAHTRQGDLARAARVQALLDVQGPVQLGGCLESSCGGFFEWSSTSGYSRVEGGRSAFGGRPPSEGLFVLERGRILGHVSSAADVPRLDTERAQVIMATRLLKPLRVQAIPPRHVLTPRVAEVVQKLLPPGPGAPGGVLPQGALPARLPVRVHAEWVGGPGDAGARAPLVVSFELSPPSGLLSPSPLILLAAWDGGPSLSQAQLALSSDFGVADSRVSLLQVLDVEGDGVGEVLVLERRGSTAAARAALWSYDPEQGWRLSVFRDMTGMATVGTLE